MPVTSFVPMSKDGSKFDRHSCLRAGGYWVGPKGSERKIGRFEDAVEALKRMAEPRWRRPNRRANWGLVKGVKWVPAI
jgi:hypothetical protein